MRFLESKSFLALNTLLGLLVNVLTLGGILFGVVKLQPGWGPLSKPVPVIILLYLFMIVIWLVVAFYFLSKAKQRRGIGDGRRIIPVENWRSSFFILMYAVTIPVTVLWVLAGIELLQSNLWSLANINPDSGVIPMLFVGAATAFFSGSGMGQLALTIDWFFNPHHYVAHPAEEDHVQLSRAARQRRNSHRAANRMQRD